MNEQLRGIADLNRVIHEPGRLMIVASSRRWRNAISGTWSTRPE